MNFWTFHHDSMSNSLLIWDFVEVDSFFDLRWFVQKVEPWFGRGGLGCEDSTRVFSSFSTWRVDMSCPKDGNNDRYNIFDICMCIYIYACCMLYARHIILSLASSPVWFSSSFATGVVKPTINHVPFCNTRWVLPHCHFYWKVSMFCMGSLESMADLRRGELAAQRIWGQTIRGSRVERAKKKDISKKFRENTSKIMKWNYHYILESDYPLFGCPPCFSF